MVELLPETATQIAADTAITLPPAISYQEFEALLAAQLEKMINSDFQQFVLLLYKVDVSEKKIREVLASDMSADVYRKIAALLIERQQQKIISKQYYSNRTNNSDDDQEERW